MNKKIWLVEFPTYKYNEDVKKLASENGLKIIDARYKDGVNPDNVAKEVPKLTLKDKPKKAK
jgi:hypothetical protein